MQDNACELKFGVMVLRNHCSLSLRFDFERHVDSELVWVFVSVLVFIG